MSTFLQPIGSVACSSLIFLGVSVLAVDDSPCLAFCWDPQGLWLCEWHLLWHNMLSSVHGRVSLFTWKTYLISVPLTAPALCSGLCQPLLVSAAPTVPRGGSVLNALKVTVFLGLGLYIFWVSFVSFHLVPAWNWLWLYVTIKMLSQNI